MHIVKPIDVFVGEYVYTLNRACVLCVHVLACLTLQSLDLITCIGGRGFLKVGWGQSQDVDSEVTFDFRSVPKE